MVKSKVSRGSKIKISSIKRNNQKRTKLTRQGKLNNRRHKKADTKAQPKQAKPVEEQNEDSDNGEDMLGMVEEDQLEYLKQAMSKKGYQLLQKLRAPPPGTIIPNKKRKGSEENGDSDGADEQDINVEQEVESDMEEEIEEEDEADDGDDIEKSYHAQRNTPTQPTKLMLPIKTSKGLVIREMQIDDAESKGGDDEDGDKTDEDDENVDNASDEPQLDQDTPITTAELIACREEILNQRKFRIGTLCSTLLENPEGRLKNFRPLFQMMDEDIPEVKMTIRKLVTVSLLEVFKDILPTYLIHVMEDKSIKLKKETFQIKQYEEALLDAYKTYLTKLEGLAKCLISKRKKKSSKGDIILGELAVKCMADLLVTNPYFNFSTNLAQCMVKFLDNSYQSVRKSAKEAIQRIFKEDKRGSLTLQIVRRINALVKNREQIANIEVLEVLLALRIKDINLDKEKEEHIEQEKLKARKMRLLTTSRNDRKRQKKMKELERDLQATKAEEDKERKHKDMTEVVKVVFMIYFRILKKDPNSKLLSVALEGLAKFSSCINLDYYHDLVNALDDLMAFGNLKYRDQLHIVQTVFTILSGQGEMLTIDPRRFYTHLYRNMLNIHAGDSHRDMLILVKAIDFMMIKRRKKITQERTYAFTKRLASMALQLLHNGSLSCLAHIKTVLQLNKSTDLLLDVDKSFGQGVFDPLMHEPEYSNAGNSTLWEVTVLKRHYHPLVQQYSSFVSAGAPETGASSLPLEFAKMSAEELFTDYDGSAMAFKPAIPPPKQVEPKQRPSKYYIANPSLDEQIQKVMKSIPSTGNFFKAAMKST